MQRPNRNQRENHSRPWERSHSGIGNPKEARMGEGVEGEEEVVMGDDLREVRCAGDQVWRLSEIKGKILDSTCVGCILM